ncbi:MAG: bifunctional folylpolyglutamate synthase/dihydrofolate synthase [Bacteroidetes bacterium]|nr:MAG: bifunctional folylpolyglutamate synthase/dihydrofolate synthase [Bacteroidota bacterium]
MNYKVTLQYLFDRLPMFHRIGEAAYKNSLENTLKLDEFFGHPHRNYKTVHVAGTNGKGSVSHMLAAVFQTAGYKTGLYTSPHLKDFRERIKINGQMISEVEVVKWIENYPVKYNLWNMEPSFFELTAALVFDYFSKQKVDIAIIEVGLGGRLDSTNIITPEVSVITNIGLDHTNLLGDTIEKIAAEKAGIIKSKVPVVVGLTQNETKQVFIETARTHQASLFFADQEYVATYSMLGLDGKQILNIERNGEMTFPEIKLDLLGMYQVRNVPVVLKTLEILVEKGWQISNKNIYEGLANAAKSTGLMGRWQIIGNNPLTVCDTGHNEDGIRMVVNQIKNTPHKTLHFVFGVVADKNQDAILRLLPTDAVYYFTRANIPRAMNEHELVQKAVGFRLKGKSYPTVAEAFNAAKVNAGKNDLIFIGGSTFVVAEIL